MTDQMNKRKFRCPLGIMVALTVAASPSLSPANPPVPESDGPRSNPFIPHAGYIRGQKQARIQRQAAPLTGAPPAGGLRGTRKLPVICVDFQNVPGPFPSEEYQEMLFGSINDRKTMTQYYRDMSNGMLNVTGKVTGWHRLPQNDSYYENGGNGVGTPFGELLQFGLEKADAELDFGEFDNDGLDGVPNSGDDDGKVDTVMFVHPELGGEFRSLTPHNIWSHSWHYSEPTYGHNGPFITKDVRRGATGNPLLGANGAPLHIVVEDYVIQPGLDEPKAGQPPTIVKIGVFCHEFGHALGLPDLYDRTPKPKADSDGIGHWCLMAAGSYGGNGQRPGTPSEMSAWCKQYLGWATIVNLEGNSVLDLEAVAERNLIYRINVPGTDNSEYYLVEYRNAAWKDPADFRINWDEHLHGSGLAIWHIDDRVGTKLPSGGNNSNWPFAGFDAGQNDSPSLPLGTSPVTWRKKHSLVSLMQADRRLDLEKRPGGGGDADDILASDSEWGDDPQFLFGSRGYSNNSTGFQITDVDLANLTCRIIVANHPIAGSPAPGGIVAPAQATAPTVASASPTGPESRLPRARFFNTAKQKVLGKINNAFSKANPNRLRTKLAGIQKTKATPVSG
ncbi:MAG: M6 family metalloprotease domain-containing protein, partial [Chitinophagaceae bacterium]